MGKSEPPTLGHGQGRERPEQSGKGAARVLARKPGERDSKDTESAEPRPTSPAERRKVPWIWDLSTWKPPWGEGHGSLPPADSVLSSAATQLVCAPPFVYRATVSISMVPAVPRRPTVCWPPEHEAMQESLAPEKGQQSQPTRTGPQAPLSQLNGLGQKNLGLCFSFLICQMRVIIPSASVQLRPPPSHKGVRSESRGCLSVGGRGAILGDPGTL